MNKNVRGNEKGIPLGMCTKRLEFTAGIVISDLEDEGSLEVSVARGRPNRLASFRGDF